MGENGGHEGCREGFAGAVGVGGRTASREAGHHLPAGVARRQGKPGPGSGGTVGHHQDRDFPRGFLTVGKGLPLVAVAAEDVDRAGERGDGASRSSMFRIAGAKSRQRAPGAERTRPASGFFSPAATRRSQGRGHPGIERVVRQGRVAAAKADRQLVAVGPAGDQQRPVRRLIRIRTGSWTIASRARNSPTLRLTGSSSDPERVVERPSEGSGKPAPMPPRSVRPAQAPGTSDSAAPPDEARCQHHPAERTGPVRREARCSRLAPEGSTSSSSALTEPARPFHALIEGRPESRSIRGPIDPEHAIEVGRAEDHHLRAHVGSPKSAVLSSFDRFLIILSACHSATGHDSPEEGEPAWRRTSNRLWNRSTTRWTTPPVRSLPHKGLTIEGYSRAAVQTVLAGARAEAGLRPGGPALVVHDHAQLVRQPHASRPHRRPAGPGRPPADDEDGAADDLPAGRGRRGRRAACSRAMQRLDRGRMPAELVGLEAGRRGRALARAGRQGVPHPAHDPLARASWSGSGGRSSSPSITT